MMPFISVVVPAYNEAELLPRCLRSLQGQDNAGDYEVILVDNGSTDATAAIGALHGARVLPCSERGVVYARAAGARIARGEIIAQADADSVYPSDWLQRIAQSLADHPERVAVAGSVRYEDSPWWARLPQAIQRGLNQRSWRRHRRPVRTLGSNFAFRKESLERCGGYNTSLPHVGDERDLLHRLQRIGEVAYDPDLVVLTSSRRFRGRFFQFLLWDYPVHNLLSHALYALFQRSLPLARSKPRQRRPQRTAWRWAVHGAFASLLLSLLSYGFFYPSAQLFGKTYNRMAAASPVLASSQGPLGEKTVALTFDDGPNEPYTSQILDLLEFYQVPATFFVVGRNVEREPATLRRIVAAGHVVGNHSYTHQALPEVSEWRYTELDRTQETIFRAAGVSPTLFRPPFGRKTPWMLSHVHSKGMVTVTWDVSANDPNTPSAQVIAQRIVAKTRPGSIVLLHDGKETIAHADRGSTVEALPIIIQELRARGYRFVTVPELLGVPAYLPSRPSTKAA